MSVKLPFGQGRALDRQKSYLRRPILSSSINGILPLVDITSTNPSAVAPMYLRERINLEIELNSNPDTAQIEIIQCCVIFKLPT